MFNFSQRNIAKKAFAIIGEYLSMTSVKIIVLVFTAALTGVSVLLNLTSEIGQLTYVVRHSINKSSEHSFALLFFPTCIHIYEVDLGR